MSGGGGQTVQTQDPWSGVQPYLHNLYRDASTLTRQGEGPQYFPGETFVRPIQEQQAPWNYGLNFMNQVFGPTGMGATWGGPGNYNTLNDWTGDRSPGFLWPGGFTADPNARAFNSQTGEAAPNTQIGAFGGNSPPTAGNVYDQNGVPVTGGGMPLGGMGGMGGGMAPNYGSMVGANQALLGGATPTAQMARQIAPFAMQQLQGAFGSPANMVGDWQSNYRPGLNRAGFNPTQTPFSFQASAGQNPSGLDPTGAINQMLSGTPNYDLVQQAVRAGAQPTLDILNEDILPGLRSRTVSSTNPTGEIKDLNRILPRVMRDISGMGTQAALGEYNRALGAQERGAGLAGDLGLGYSNLGMQGAQFGAGLGENLQNRLMNMSQFNAGLGENFQNRLMDTSQFNASLGLQSDLGQQQALNAMRSGALGLGNLGAGLGGQYSSDLATGVGQFPSVMQTGLMPFNMGQGYGQYAGGFENMALMDAMNRFNYGQQMPYNELNFMSGILSGAGGLGGSSTQSSSSNPWLGAAGGALGGAALGSSLMSAGVLNAWNPWGWALMGGGALLGGLGSQ